jgi:hypothetical protein
LIIGNVKTGTSLSLEWIATNTLHELINWVKDRRNLTEVSSG